MCVCLPSSWSDPVDMDPDSSWLLAILFRSEIVGNLDVDVDGNVSGEVLVAVVMAMEGYALGVLLYTRLWNICLGKKSHFASLKKIFLAQLFDLYLYNYTVISKL